MKDKLQTVQALLDFCQQQYPGREAFLWRSKDVLHKICYKCFAGQVRALAAYFAEQTSAGAHIAIVGSNSYQWLLGWFGVVCAGRVAVPLDAQLMSDELLQQLTQSDAELLLHAKDYDDVAQRFGNSLSLDALPISPAAVGWPCTVAPNDLASIVFTSGTTGASKGVMLSHWNLMSNALSCCDFINLSGHRKLSVLPFNHIFSLISGMLSRLPGGNAVCICGGARYLSKDFAAFRPSHMTVVPLLVEKLYEKIWDTAKKEGKDKLLKRMLRLSNGLLEAGIDVRRKLFSKVLAGFGGQLEWLFVGGAPIAEEYVEGLAGFGIEVLTGYGTTECAPAISLTRCRAYRAKSVGQVMGCNKVKIDPQGEILVKGDNVFAGYYKDETATAEAFTDDGWYKTGDLGRLDKDRYLYITGRIKNLIILSNGKNVSPELLEERLTQIPYVKEALVFAQDDKLAAELFLDEEMQQETAQLDADIAQLNRTLPAYQRIETVHVRSTEFPKTTTKKIRRTK